MFQVFHIIIIGAELAESLLVLLEKPNMSPDELQWSFITKFEKGSILRSIMIDPIIPYDLKGRIETFHVIFTQRDSVVSQYNSYLEERIVSGPSSKKRTIATIFEVVGKVFTASIYIQFIFSVLLSMKSNPAFWGFIGTMQILAYMPMIECVIPFNLEFLLTEYFGVSKGSIPFDSFPSWVPNPKEYVELFNTDSFSSGAENIKYTSASFLYNFGQDLVTWCCLVLFYLTLMVGESILPKSLYKFIYNL